MASTILTSKIDIYIKKNIKKHYQKKLNVIRELVAKSIYDINMRIFILF